MNYEISHAEALRMEDTYQVPSYSKVPFSLERGKGAHVWDGDGKRYIDFYGGHCVAIIGHCPEAVVEAVRRQSEKLIFYSNISYSSIRGIASKMLCDAAPDGIDHVFFSNSGSEANETALKLARKYTGRTKIVAMEGGFHGRTLGSLAATHGLSYREPYASILPETVFVPFGDAEAVQNFIASDDDIAAVIVEPIQSMAGMRTAPPSYFQSISEACSESGTMLIFDEIQTGCGRTGTFSYSEHVGIVPDIITLAKSLASGIPIGATLVSNALADSVNAGDHGTTFGGGMIAMAAAAATLNEILSNGLMARAVEIGITIKTRMSPLVKDVRGQGCLVGLDLGFPARPTVAALRERGVLVGGSSDPHTMRLMPPINCPQEILDQGLDIIADVIESGTPRL